MDTVVLDNEPSGILPTDNPRSMRGGRLGGARTFSVVVARHFEINSSSLQYRKEARPIVSDTAFAWQCTSRPLAEFAGLGGGIARRGLYLDERAEGDNVVGVLQHQIPQAQPHFYLNGLSFRF